VAHFEIVSFLTAAIGLLGLLCVCQLAFGRIGAGSAVAFLVAGVVIGHFRDLPPETVHILQEIAELGVVLLLFLIGLEITPPQLRDLGRDALTLGVPQIVVTAALIGGYVWWRLGTWDTAVIIGLGLSLSSTMVVVELLTDRDELHLPWGRKSFAILLAQDLVIVPFLLIVSLMADRSTDDNSIALWLWNLARAGVVVAGIILVGRFLLGRVLAVAIRRNNEPAFVCAIFFAVLAAALASEKAGLSMALGTFLLGGTLSTSPFGHRIATSVEPAKSALLALFFLSIGFTVDLDVVKSFWVTLLVNATVIIVIKFVILFVVAFSSRVVSSDALRIALALSQFGEFGFVLFAAAQVGGLMTPELSVLASVLITISMLTTPFLIRLGPSYKPINTTK
jgi:glutathione-regulated potassium-efflux system ancillary protein KefC